MILAEFFDCMSLEEEYEYVVKNEFTKAVDEKDEQQINLLIQKESLLRKKKVIPRIHTFLHVVAERGTIETASKLLELGADVNTRNKLDETPIYYAIRNSVEMVEFLIENGAEVNLRNFKAESPLHRAVRLQLPNIVKRLLYDDADVNQKVESVDRDELVVCGAIRTYLTDLGMTPLHDACKYGNVEIARTLLQFDANVRLRNAKSLLALYYAAVRNSFEIVDLLLKTDLGADMRNVPRIYIPFFMRHDDKEQPVRMRMEMMEYLLYCGGYINEDETIRCNDIFSFALYLQRHDVVECLLELGVNYRRRHILLETSIDRIFGLRVPRCAMNQDVRVLIPFIALKESFHTFVEYSHIFIAYNENNVWQARGIMTAHFLNSKLEQEKLRDNKIIKETKISFYDILTRNIYRAVQIAKNRKIRNVLLKKLYSEEFPYYSYLIEKRVERITYSENWVDITEDFLMNYGDVPLPLLAVGKILSYLRSVDFLIFGKEVLSTRRE